MAQKIARQAKPGDIFALKGDLGSGKTTFAQGFASALGIKNIVTSPTFVISKSYPVSENKNGIKELVHIDCYRLNQASDAESIGLSDYLEDENCVLLIEWPEEIWGAIKNRAKEICFETVSENERKITL